MHRNCEVSNSVVVEQFGTEEASRRRRSELKGHIKSLNDQFAGWIEQQHKTNTFGVWSASCEDYVKYLKELESEFSDVLPDQNSSQLADAKQVLLFGTGDCGQLGFGEDVLELSIPKQLNIRGLPVVNISCGGMHTVVITGDGNVWSWGVNDEGALGRLAKSANQWTAQMGGAAVQHSPSDVSETVPGLVGLPSGSRAIQVTAGDSHTFIVTSSGT